MTFRFPSAEWTRAYQDAVNDNAAYAEAAKDWTFGAVAMVVSKDPSLDLTDDMVMLLDVHEGKCRGTAFERGLAAADTAPFVIVANYDRWKEVIRGELDPTKGMMQGKLKLTKGLLPVMIRFVEASKQLVQSATKIPTEFID